MAVGPARRMYGNQTWQQKQDLDMKLQAMRDKKSGCLGYWQKNGESVPFYVPGHLTEPPCRGEG